MSEFRYITLREEATIKDRAAEWFHSKWGVPKEAYLECMNEYLSGETEYGWYLCLDGEKIVAGMGVIENDFHDRKDLSPNVCAVYTEEDYRDKGIAGNLLNMVVDDMKAAVSMARAGNCPIAFAGWGRTEFPEITAEMSALCDYAFDSTEKLEKFLFD